MAYCYCNDLKAVSVCGTWNRCVSLVNSFNKQNEIKIEGQHECQPASTSKTSSKRVVIIDASGRKTSLRLTLVG
jgi:hypothetical protein